VWPLRSNRQQFEFNFLATTAHESFDVGRAEPHVRFGAVDNINSCAMSCERCSSTAEAW
jgi:hypothetical protein